MPFLVLAGVLWGTGGLLGSLLAERTGLSALAVAGYRLAGGGLVLVALLALSGRRPRGPAAWRRIAAIGALAAVFQAAYFTAVSLTSVSLATLVTIGSAPVVVLLVERAGGWAMVGTVGLAVLGIVLLVGLPGGGLDPASALLGSALAVVAGSGFAAMTLLAARPVPGLDAALTTGPAFLLGGSALLVPLAAVDPSAVAFVPEPGALVLLVAFAVLPTAAAYTCYFRGLAASTASVGAVTALLEPLTAAVLAAVVLGERLGAAGTVGAALVGAAVVLAGRQERERSA
ncbi:DMT family transporter [Pseudonocardia humida]|uniref:EamA family transporter n=1 Tax=Pseudonocardia humida TaxID=2800819 RepID=A0ABT1A3E8_9PSEU|nr:DMT family transporter [Pseudonocardia humida]MCO1657523.1 EamA family transporter [Pseudonocardia humida]